MMIKYHWAILIGPKLEDHSLRGLRFHAKEKVTPNGTEWFFEERDIPLAPTGMLLVRIMIGKVRDKARAIGLLRNTPIKQGQPGWNCVVWVKETLEALKADGKAMGTSILDWKSVRDGAMDYCQRKKDEHRFDGRGSSDSSKAPTYDLIEGKETIE